MLAILFLKDNKVSGSGTRGMFPDAAVDPDHEKKIGSGSANLREIFTICMYQCCGSEIIFSDPDSDPTSQEILDPDSDLDPDPISDPT